MDGIIAVLCELIIFLNLLFCASGCNSFTLTSLEHKMVLMKEHCAYILRSGRCVILSELGWNTVAVGMDLGIAFVARKKGSVSFIHLKRW